MVARLLIRKDKTEENFSATNVSGPEDHVTGTFLVQPGILEHDGEDIQELAREVSVDGTYITKVWKPRFEQAEFFIIATCTY